MREWQMTTKVTLEYKYRKLNISIMYIRTKRADRADASQMITRGDLMPREATHGLMGEAQLDTPSGRIVRVSGRELSKPRRNPISTRLWCSPQLLPMISRSHPGRKMLNWLRYNN